MDEAVVFSKFLWINREVLPSELVSEHDRLSVLHLVAQVDLRVKLVGLFLYLELLDDLLQGFDALGLFLLHNGYCFVVMVSLELETLLVQLLDLLLHVSLFCCLFTL